MEPHNPQPQPEVLVEVQVVLVKIPLLGVRLLSNLREVLEQLQDLEAVLQLEACLELLQVNLIKGIEMF